MKNRALCAVVVAIVVDAGAGCTPTIACDPAAGDDTCPAGFACGADGVCVDAGEGEGEPGEGEGEPGEGEGEGEPGEGEGEGEGELDPEHAVHDGLAGCCGLARFRVGDVARGGLAAGFVDGELVVALTSATQGVRVLTVGADDVVRRDNVDDGEAVTDINMAVDRGGRKPHIVYRVDGDTDRVRHAVRDNDLWFADDVSAQELFPNPQITIDEDSGLPWVVFQDPIVGLVQVVEFTGSAWEKHAVAGSGTTSTPAGQFPDLVAARGEATVVFTATTDGFTHFGFEDVNEDFTLALVDDAHFASDHVRVAESLHTSGDLLVGYGGADSLSDQSLAAYFARRHAGDVSVHLVDDSAALVAVPIVEEGAAGVWAAYVVTDGGDGNVIRLAHASSGDDIFTASTVADDGPFAGIDMTLDDNGMPIVVLSRLDDDLEIARAP